jgi:hypothetical protein
MGFKLYQHFPFRGPPKYTQTGNFDIEINHLATLLTTAKYSILMYSFIYILVWIHLYNLEVSVPKTRIQM